MNERTSISSYDCNTQTCTLQLGQYRSIYSYEWNEVSLDVIALQQGTNFSFLLEGQKLNENQKLVTLYLPAASFPRPQHTTAPQPQYSATSTVTLLQLTYCALFIHRGSMGRRLVRGNKIQQRTDKIMSFIAPCRKGSFVLFPHMEG